MSNNANQDGASPDPCDDLAPPALVMSAIYNNDGVFTGATLGGPVSSANARSVLVILPGAANQYRAADFEALPDPGTPPAKASGVDGIGGIISFFFAHPEEDCVEWSWEIQRINSGPVLPLTVKIRKTRVSGGGID